MLVERVFEPELSRADEIQIADLLNDCFGTEFGDRSYFQQRHSMRIIMRKEGQILGHIGLTYRDIRIGEALIPVIGVGDVATTPNARGQGIAQTLLSDAIEYAKTSQAAFMVLFGDRPLYAGHGFQNVHNPIKFVRMTDARTRAVEGGIGQQLMILPVGQDVWDPHAPVDFLGHLF